MQPEYLLEKGPAQQQPLFWIDDEHERWYFLEPSLSLSSFSFGTLSLDYYFRMLHHTYHKTLVTTWTLSLKKKNLWISTLDNCANVPIFFYSKHGFCKIRRNIKQVKILCIKSDSEKFTLSSKLKRICFIEFPVLLWIFLQVERLSLQRLYFFNQIKTNKSNSLGIW